jgi:hypothetical protein
MVVQELPHTELALWLAGCAVAGVDVAATRLTAASTDAATAAKIPFLTDMCVLRACANKPCYRHGQEALGGR